MKKLTFIALILISYISFTSCTKQQGIEGQQGPTGATGSQGANLSSYYLEGPLTFTEPPFLDSIPVLNIDRYPSNLVDIYYTVDNTTSAKARYYQMPATDVFVSGDELSYYFGDNYIYIFYTGTTNPDIQYPYLFYRIIIIPQ